MNIERKFVFRCDAGGYFGIGHLLRCRSIAHEIEAISGQRPLFLIHTVGSLPSDLVSNIAWRTAPSPVGTQVDIGFMGRELATTDGLPLIVIDSKLADDSYIRQVRRSGVVCCIQDEAPPESCADIVLNNHVGAEKWYANSCCEQVRLLGHRFNTVHSDYFDLANKTGRTNVLITFGGSDPQNHSLWFINNVCDLFFPHSIDIVVGPSHPDSQSVFQAAARYDNIQVAFSPASLVPHASRAFLAVSAGGTTCYELLAAGIATTAVAVEAHQRPLIDALVGHGAILDLGGPSALSLTYITKKLREVVGNPAIVEKCRNAGTALFSHSGLTQIVNQLMKVGYRR